MDKPSSGDPEFSDWMKWHDEQMAYATGVVRSEAKKWRTVCGLAFFSGLVVGMLLMAAIMSVF